MIGSRQLDNPETLLPALDEAVAALNELFAPAIAAPFLVVYDDALHGALTDAVQAPLCVSVLRELLAPLQVRVGVALDGSAEDAFVAAWHEDRLVHYSGTGVAGDLLLNAFCAMVDPLVRARYDAEWQAVRTVRRHETRAAAAGELGIGVDELDGVARRRSLAAGRGRRRHDRRLPRPRPGRPRLVPPKDYVIGAQLARLRCAPVRAAGRRRPLLVERAQSPPRSASFSRACGRASRITANCSSAGRSGCRGS